MQERHMKTEKSLEYHTELEKAAEERKRTQALDLLKEKQQTKQVRFISVSVNISL